MDEASTMDRPPIMDRLFQGIQHEAGMRCPADPPAHDIAGEHVDYEGDVDEACPCCDIGKVGDPQLLGAGAWNWRLT